jgi:solute carrier family 8 (sodium/calcium exchanger)
MNYFENILQSNEVGSAVNAEKEGLVRCLRYLEDCGFGTKILVTDRHPQVRKFMREEMAPKGTKHFYDVWHVAKGINCFLLYICQIAYFLNVSNITLF